MSPGVSLGVTGCRRYRGGLGEKLASLFYGTSDVAIVSGYEWLLFFHDFGEWDGILIVEHN